MAAISQTSFLEHIFLNENHPILMKISLKFVIMLYKIDTLKNVHLSCIATYKT